MTEETNQPTEAHAQPELKQILGALLFAARKPIAAGELLEILAQVAQNGEDAAHAFGKIKESDIRTALEQLKAELGERKLGLILVEVAGGFRFQTDPAGGPWVRQLLNLDKPARLSKPALETLAIIAYRQPTTRAEIEALRGVNVDAMMRHLLELQLIRIVGRSDLPGRPLMYGTTQLFLEHFGLSSVKNLPGVEQLSRRDAERVKRESEGGRRTPDAGPEKMEDGLKTDDGHRTTDTGPEKTEDGLKTDDGGRTPDASPEMTEDSIKTDDPQRKAEGVEEEKTDVEDEDDDEDEDEDEDEDFEEKE
ncbi:MAG: SMC-Scp complex subunit ScpB [Verrucomicrobia bacterium]|nr:SMC-Scp complex subunit ScpB [Verrucomicrobiota bacterium]MBU1735176.1 SMC-Scp complex subunit ScpB [Verrucomicrobiota bacterium]MBU1855959.1 SMC-Scp complex subunit ScpB [Verrucomicrobiota bacterium]